MSLFECRKLSNISANIAVTIFRVDNFQHLILLIPESRSSTLFTLHVIVIIIIIIIIIVAY
jgi:hypothetical protein